MNYHNTMNLFAQKNHFPAETGKCFGLLFNFIYSHNAYRRYRFSPTDQLRRPQGTRSARVERIRQPENLCGRRDRTDCHPLPLPHIDHIDV